MTGSGSESRMDEASSLFLPSPAGPLLVRYVPEGVRTVEHRPGSDGPPPGARTEAGRDDELGRQIAREIGEFFAGRRGAFSLPLAIQGSSFQFRVWEAVSRIPHGETRTFGEIAREVGRPGAAGAVSRAVRANPLPLIVPGHRVVAAKGLGSYVACGDPSAGPEIKRLLLRHEARVAEDE